MHYNNCFTYSRFHGGYNLLRFKPRASSSFLKQTHNVRYSVYKLYHLFTSANFKMAFFTVTSRDTIKFLIKNEKLFKNYTLSTD